MKTSFLVITSGLLAANLAWAVPGPQDRVYTADQNSNTVSVINPATNALLGQIRLGNQRPDVLSPLYKGEINVHGLGFSPDHKTLLAVSTGSNSVTFIDTSTNQVKGKAYVGRAPHEAFFTQDGREVWAVVRGEDYLSVIDPATFRETGQVKVAPGPGMVRFHTAGKLAFVVSSFTPEVDVVDVASHQVVKRITVASPFSPFLQFTPDGKEMWMTHKDIGKVTRIDTDRLEVVEVFETGPITNHLGFARTAGYTLAYVTIGGENAVKVYTTGPKATLVTTIPVGPLPHGIWPSDDSSRIYIGLENGDAVDVIDTSTNKVVSRIPVGQAPQALVYISNAVSMGSGTENLAQRVNSDPVNIVLKPLSGDAKGSVVARNLGLTDSIDVSLSKLKPETAYSVYASGQAPPIAVLKTDKKGSASGTAIGPMRKISKSYSAKPLQPSRIIVMEGNTPANIKKAALVSGS